MEKENPYNVFNRHGGKITREQLAWQVDRIPSFQPWEREYIKRVLERYDTDTNRYITREEFFQGLEEMAKNDKDPITPEEVERIKKAFLQ